MSTNNIDNGQSDHDNYTQKAMQYDFDNCPQEHFYSSPKCNDEHCRRSFHWYCSTCKSRWHGVETASGTTNGDR